MKLVPLGDKVVLRQLVAEETTKSGIVYPVKKKTTAGSYCYWTMAWLMVKKLLCK